MNSLLDIEDNFNSKFKAKRKKSAESIAVIDFKENPFRKE